MTLAMPDSINVNNLPPGYDAYLGYVDGEWPTAAALAVKFPGVQLVRLTVTGHTLLADGCDIESGDLTPTSGARWARSKLDGDPLSRPVLYANVTTMASVVIALNAAQVMLTDVRLLSAHWGFGAHICGPGTCGLIGIDMDSTQWTNQWIVTELPRGPLIDMSMLADDFFTGSTGLNWTERIMQELPTVQIGLNGAAVRRVQGLCNAWNPSPNLSVDGVFGISTKKTVQAIQAEARITADGIVGPQTWPVLLGVA